MDEYFYNIKLNKNPEYDILFPHLFPNYIDIFPIKLQDNQILYLINNYPRIFSNILFPLLKNKWNNHILSIDIENNVFFLSDKKNNDNEVIIDIENEIFKENVKNNNENFQLEYNDVKFTPETYAFLKVKKILEKNIDIVKLTNILKEDIHICKGIIDGAESLGIITGSKKFTINNINIYNSLKFTEISLDSLKSTFQYDLFKHYINKDTVFITGGTGIGKTSQIPKLLFWFDTLFSGYENYKTYKFSLHKNTLLSLPKVQLVKFFKENFNKSLNIKTNQYMNEYYYGAEIDNIFDKTKIIASTNKITSKRFITKTNLYNINSIVLDEIHEADIHNIINITLLKKYRNNFGAIFIMSATLGENEHLLSEYFPYIKSLRLPNKQLFEIKEYDMYDKNKKDIDMLRDSIKKYYPKKNEAAIVFCSSIKEITDLNKLLSEEFPNILFISIYSKEKNINENLKKIDNVTDPIILLSTNLLENSITIKKLKIIYDFGTNFVKKFYGIEKRIITEESMIQRKGRVGRVSNGIYIKLYKNTELFNFLLNSFLYPIIIYDDYYELNDIYQININPELITRYDKEKKLLHSYYNNINYVFNLYNNNLCSNLESIKIYMYKDQKIKDAYKLLEEKEITIDLLQSIDLNILKKISYIINLPLYINNSNDLKFKNPFYKNIYTRFVKIGKSKKYNYLIKNIAIAI